MYAFFQIPVMLGVLLVAWGVMIILNNVADLKLPTFRIVLALALVYFGVFFLVQPNVSSTFNRYGEGDAPVPERTVGVGEFAPLVLDEDRIFDARLGTMVIDLENASIVGPVRTLYLVANFATIELTLPEGQAVSIEGNYSFGVIEGPAQEGNIFSGRYKYESEGFEAATNRLYLFVGSSFSTVEIDFVEPTRNDTPTDSENGEERDGVSSL